VLLSLYVGVTYFVGLVLDVMAYQRGNAVMIAWLEYFAIPLAFIYQVFVFEQIPGEIEGMGAAFVLVGCMLPALHELVMIVMQKKSALGDSDDDDESYQMIDDRSNDSLCYGLGSSALGYDVHSEFDSEEMEAKSMTHSLSGTPDRRRPHVLV